MKKILLNTLIFSSVIVGSMMLSSCNNVRRSVSLKNGDHYFINNSYIDLNNIPEQIQFAIEIEGKIQDISVGTILIKPKDFNYRKGILTINGNVLKDEYGELKISSGDNRFEIFTGSTMYYHSCLMVDKVIKTPEDFQSINNNPLGSYILGNDIDFENSNITNFEPLGYAESDSHYNQEFGGVFDGNGYAIKNLQTRYSLDGPEDDKVDGIDQYEGHFVFQDDAHSAGTQFGVFQSISKSGIVRNVSFNNCFIFGKTIVGVVAGTNNGLIENVFIDKNCQAIAATHFYDDDCNVGTIAGINGEGTIKNVISMGTSKIVKNYIDYDDSAYDDLATEEVETSHNFWSGVKSEENMDSNGLVSTGVYAGIGMSWGEAYDCVAMQFTNASVAPNLYAPFGQTHLAINKPSSGAENTGLISNCVVLTEDEMKNASTYTKFSSAIWNISEGTIPTFKNPYPTAKYH